MPSKQVKQQEDKILLDRASRPRSNYLWGLYGKAGACAMVFLFFLFRGCAGGGANRFSAAEAGVFPIRFPSIGRPFPRDEGARDGGQAMSPVLHFGHRVMSRPVRRNILAEMVEPGVALFHSEIICASLAAFGSSAMFSMRWLEVATRWGHRVY
jgi:hypothetical protein